MPYLKILLVTIVMMLSSCNMLQQSLDKHPRNTTNQTTPQPINVQNKQNDQFDWQQNKRVANHLVNLATRIHGVNDAMAVVFGNYTVVGIDVDEDLERSEVSSIKYSVAESLKDDPHGRRAIVIADPDLRARLQEVVEDIKSDRPIKGIMDELADITGRVMPELPRDLIEPKEPKPQNAPEEQKDKLDSNEKRRIDEQQQKQSNDHK